MSNDTFQISKNNNCHIVTVSYGRKKGHKVMGWPDTTYEVICPFCNQMTNIIGKNYYGRGKKCSTCTNTLLEYGKATFRCLNMWAAERKLQEFNSG